MSRLNFPGRNTLLYYSPFLILSSVSWLHCNASNNIDRDCGVSYETDQVVSNWSSVHTVHPGRIYYPTSAIQVQQVLMKHHILGMKIRPIGTALSPNGIGFNGNNSLISLAHLDFVDVNKRLMQVRVGAGATVHSVLKELSKHDLTLENFSSIQEQQIGGWTQVAAHGTGCKLSTVDEMIIDMTMALPFNHLFLSKKSNPELFRFAKVGLGSLGIVTDLTLKCMPRMKLKELTFTSSINEIKDDHNKRLLEFRHVRYMWLPYTSTIVGVVSNPVNENDNINESNKTVDSFPTQPLIDCLLSLSDAKNKFKQDLQTLSFSQLRDLLISYNPLDLQHIMKVNAAEAKYWQGSQGVRIADSTDILGFDCGGEQLVLEVCFAIGNENSLCNKDIKFVEELLKLIEDNKIPAPAPIEQRWSAASSAPMSPAYSDKADDIFSWVGIILYLPSSLSQKERNEVKVTFEKYVDVIQPLLKKYHAKMHWAKIELPNSEDKIEELSKSIHELYPVDTFNTIRKIVDPNRVLSNELIDKLFK